MTEPNKFEIRAVQLDLNGRDRDWAFEFWGDTDGFKAFGIDIVVDGVRLEPSTAVSLWSVLNAARNELTKVKARIFTCGCGYSECVQVDEPVTVTYENGLVIWQCQHPLVTSNRPLERPHGEPVTFRQSKMEEQCRNLV